MSFKGPHKPKLLDIVERNDGMAVVQIMENTSALVSATKLMHREMFNKDRVKHMQEQLEEA